MRLVLFICFVTLVFLEGKSQKVSSTYFYYFASSSESLLSRDEIKLNALCDSLQQKKVISVTITGHTDDSGDEDMNLILSEERAAYVKKVLTDKNISADKISIVALGEMNPVAPNDTDKNKAKNRRVEVFIVWE